MQAPPQLEGTSFVPLLKDPLCKWKGAAFTQVLMPAEPKDVMGRALRTDRWRYIEWDEGKQGTQLYDHENDPHEYTNLTTDSQHAATVKKLSVQLKEGWRKILPLTRP
jgi:iduronate 2-sulfatase